MEKDYAYLGIQLFFTVVNLYFMEQTRESNAKVSNFCAFAAGLTFMGSVRVALDLAL